MSDSLMRPALVLGLLSSVGPFAIDMYLPAMPEIGRDLAAAVPAMQGTITAYFLAFGLAQLVYGPWADQAGRKRPLYAGLAVFLLGTLICALAGSVEVMWLGRFVQGLGGAAVMVVPRAIIRDMATGHEATRLMAAIMLVISVSPMLAPLAGSIVLAFAGWRMIFAVLAVAALVSLAMIRFVLAETLPQQHRQTFDMGRSLQGARRLLTDRGFMGLTFLGGFGMASFFVFLSSASFVYTSQYGMSPKQFSLAFAVNAIGFFTASQFAGWMTQRFGMERVISVAITMFALLSTLLTVIVLAGFDALPVVMTGLFCANAFLGLVMPTAMVMSLDPHPDIAGLASSLGGTIQMLTGGVMIAVTGPFLDNSAATMVPAIALCALLAWLSAALSLPRLRLRAA